MGDSSERRQAEETAYCGDVPVMKDVPSASIENISENLACNNEEEEHQEPKVGMVFESYDEVFRFYKEYGHRKGFGVVVKRSWFRKGKCRRADLSCWKGGSGSTNQQSSLTKPTAKTNCPAMITARIWKDDLLFVTDVVLEHNHLLSPSKARYFRCNRKFPVAVEKRLDCTDEVGIFLQDSDSLVVQNGGHKSITIGPNESRSYIERDGTVKLKERDFVAICDYLLHMQRMSPNFFYLLDWDEEGHLRNVFWADAKSRAAYNYFGDVVTLDTTYLRNGYDMPFASFVGVNHHGQSVLFGCGLLASGTSENYVWLFEAWLSCMSRCSPKAIITDQCISIQYAVSEAFPESRHRFCLLHVLKKIPEKLGNLEQYKPVKKELKRLVYDALKISEFEDGWKRMIEEFGLESHKWLQELYDGRYSWVPVFLKNTFWAGMSTIRRNECMNSFFDEHINSKTSLQQLLSIYEMALQEYYEREAHADFESFHDSHCLLTQFPMEEKLSKLYTMNMFKKFQEELKATINCDISIVRVDGSITFFEVRECRFHVDDKEDKRKGIKEFEVSYNACGIEVECVCQGFNFDGIVCRHVLSVLKFYQEYNLPSRYILDRWRKDYKRLRAFAPYSDNAVATNELERYDLLTKRSLQLLDLAAFSDSNFRIVIKLLDKIERSSW